MAFSPLAVGSEVSAEPGGSGRPGEEADGEREPPPRLGERLVPGSRLKEVVGASLASLCLGPLAGPQRLGTLLDCLVLNYRLRQGLGWSRGRGAAAEGGGAAEGPLRCCGCGRFLGEPVTVPCGHTYCRRCLRRELRARCRRCRDWLLPAGGTSTAAAPLRTSVVLNQLAEKWFPGECERARTGSRLEELLAQGRFREALAAASQALRADSSDLMLRIYRAESYVGLQEYKTAIEDLNFVISKMPNWPEVYFRKGKVLQDSGFVGDALQLFLQCLALDEDFLPAKLEVERTLCDVLSPEKLGESLKESAWNSPHIRNKPFILGSEVTESYCNLQLCPEQSLGGSDVLEPVSRSLNRAQSAHALNSTKDRAKEDGLKRVSSEPLLSGQEKGALLKRKLSFSEQDTVVCEDGRNKHKKQGEGTKRDMTLAFGTIPGDLIDVSDFECSLCMRLFFEPVTTPCGHTFCKGCLERCLDHAPQCPLCKESLKEYLASRKYSITELLEELIMKYLSDELYERKRIHAEETAEHSNFADYGCMLQIRNVHFLPDGRSVVDTVGGKRFRVLRRGMKDGYCTADIEYLEDVKVADEEQLKKLRELHNFVYNQACSWFQNLRNKFRTQILQHFGPMPDREENIQAMPNGPAWCWWLLAVLPVDPRYQLSVLSMMSLKDRLIKIQHILTYFSRDQSK
ncbi:LON peptidase N-terminal domain and RING finger protein 1 isoform X2 [Aquila chrysaetos chrysaetos]|uniref:LON peptidase N-terminal domain and RING finger protein 1 isoform X2 n=1 Tax=Aquila chrysaetos chrysaetos TaxID=223781 RepID=UPI0005D0C453|nr:LON peptidase N-terminal domain and RING finger protein 1 isoform X2 [Aquila chrysaetos chrysaetos]